VTQWFSYPSAAVASYGTIGSWEKSAMTTLASLFSSRPTFNSDISGWNTASATSFSQMFYGATAFNQNIGRWNVARVRDL